MKHFLDEHPLATYLTFVAFVIVVWWAVAATMEWRAVSNELQAAQGVSTRRTNVPSLESSVARLMPQQYALSRRHEAYEVPPGRPFLLTSRSTILTWREVFDLAYSVSGDDLWAGEAAHVIMCESTGNIRAVGDDGRAHGLGQVWPRFWGPVPDTARGQIAQIFVIYQVTSDWQHWTCRKVLA